MVRAGLALIFVGWAAFSLAADRVEYTVQFDPLGNQALVEMDLPEGETAEKFWMSAWVPGDYERFDYGKTVTAISFFKDGEEVKLAGRDGVNGFVADEKFDAVKYTVKPSRGNFSYNLYLGRDYAWLSPAGVLGFAEGGLGKPVSLTVRKIDGWKIHGAIEGRSTDSGYTMDAKNHEEMGDSPVVMGRNLATVKFEVGGKSHFFVGFGNLAGVDAAAFGAMCQKAVEQGLKEFGDLPYPRYTFFGEFGNYPAGLEHGTSCRLGFWGTDAQQMSGLIFHEYVHAFNVKAIRPKELRPIDPLNPPVVDSLWWLEGVTDYFSEVWRLRAGVISGEEFLSEMRSAYESTLRNPAYAKVSASESSRRVFEVRGSQGFGGVSYYTKGKVIGFVLDLMIRDAAEGKRTLSDTFRALYKETRDEVGYGRTMILDLVRADVPGEDRAEELAKLIETAEPVPWNATLVKAGIVDRAGRLVKGSDLTEKQKAVWESLFGKD